MLFGLGCALVDGVAAEGGLGVCLVGEALWGCVCVVMSLADCNVGELT